MDEMTWIAMYIHPDWLLGLRSDTSSYSCSLYFSFNLFFSLYHVDQTESMANALKKFVRIEKLLNGKIGAK